MKNKDATHLRGAWIPQARGRVLEIGIGSGLNLPSYSREVECVYGVEPSAELQRMARERAKRSNTKVEFLSQVAEDQIARGHLVAGAPHEFQAMPKHRLATGKHLLRTQAEVWTGAWIISVRRYPST
jgi:hypothetical protein